MQVVYNERSCMSMEKCPQNIGCITDHCVRDLSSRGCLVRLPLECLVVVENGAATEAEGFDEAYQLVILFFDQGADRPDPFLLTVSDDPPQEPDADAVVLVIGVDEDAMKDTHSG